MPATPAITLSSLDYERLTALLETCAHDHPVAGRLEAELDRAEVVEPQTMPAGVVTMNSAARILLDGDEKLLTLVYPRDADSEQGRISVLAPIGAALLGLSAGQSIQWPTPSGSAELTVLEIVYQPEAAGEFHR